MGGLCSRSAEVDPVFANADTDADSAHKHSNKGTDFTTAPQVCERMERNQREPATTTTADEEFYDRIPRFADDSLPHKSRAKQAAVAKVSEVSSRLGRAGTIGFGKAVEVLDTLGSSMTNLNDGSGFVSGSAIKGNEISILAFEVANTIVEGFNLLQSLSPKSIRHLKEEVLLSEVVQDLVSKDKDELLSIVEADKRNCTMNFMLWIDLNKIVSVRMKTRIKEVIEKLVDIVHFLNLEISNAFESADGHKPIIGHFSNHQRLGPAGLALHYANIVLQIDTL